MDPRFRTHPCTPIWPSMVFPGIPHLPVLLIWLVLTALPAAAEMLPVRTFLDQRVPLVGRAHGMMQDERGVIWIWGNEGAASYDGARFTAYNERHGLPNDYTYHIRPAGDGHLFFCTYDGLVRLDTATGQIDTVVQLLARPVRDVAMRGDDLLLATDHGVLLDRDGIRHLLAAVSSTTGRDRNSMVHNLHYDAERDLLYAATERIGLAVFDMAVVDSLIALRPGVDLDSLRATRAGKRPAADPVVVPPTRGFEPIGEDLWQVQDSDQRRALWVRACTLVIDEQYIGQDGLPAWNTLQVIGHPSGNGVLIRDAYRALRYDERGLRPSRIQLPDPTVRIHGISVAWDGTIGVVTGSGAFLFSPDGKRSAWGRQDGLLSSHTTTHLRDRQGFDWFADRRGNLQRVASRAVTLYHVHDHPSLADLIDVHPLPNGDILAATSIGLVRLSDDHVEPRVLFNDLDGDYFGFGVDRFGDVLLTMASGIYHVQIRSDAPPRLVLRPDGVHDGVARYSTSPNGDLFTVFGDKLLRWDGRRLELVNAQGYPIPLYLDARVDGRVFAGHWAWLSESSLDGAYHRRYHRDKVDEYRSDQGLSIPTSEMTMRDYRFPHVLKDEFSAQFGAMGPDGGYWVGSFSAGLVRLTLSDDASIVADSLRLFNIFTADLPSDEINGLRVLHDGRLQFLLSQHVALVDSAGLRVRAIHPPAPLSGYMHVNDRTEVLATESGLLVRRDSVEVMLNKGFGLRENAVTALHSMPDGRVLARQPNGLVLVDVAGLPWDRGIAGPPLITLQPSGRNRPSSLEELTLPPENRRFQARVALPDFLNEHQVRYRWWLEGFEDEPREYTEYDLIEYINLPPGRYQLHLEAIAASGEHVARERLLTVIVPPTFTETLAFALLMALVGLGVIGLVVYWWYHRARERARWQVELEHQKLEMANRLAATIAHEFNNPLQIIRSTSDMLQATRSDDESVQKLAAKLPHAVNRMRDLIKKLHTLTEFREIDYAAGMRILDLHGPYDPARNHESSASDSGRAGHSGESEGDPSRISASNPPDSRGSD